MTTDSRNDIGKILKQARVMLGLTVGGLATTSGVSVSHLGRIERRERFPSAAVLRKLAKPLGFEEGELFTRAGFLSPEASTTESETGTDAARLDRYVAMVLAQETVEVQRTVIGALLILKTLARATDWDIGFAEYAHRKYPFLDEDLIIMIEDLIKRASDKEEPE